MFPLQCMGSVGPQPRPPVLSPPIPLLLIHIYTHYTKIWLYNLNTNGMNVIMGRDIMESIIRILLPCWLCYHKKGSSFETTKIITK